MSAVGERRPRLFTIGHSNRPLELFFRVLEGSCIRLVADVRSNPASARFPHFERHALSCSLESRGVAYRWFRGLGGQIDETVPGEAVHTALDPIALRRYAAKMNTEKFNEIALELLGLASSTVAVILCAEQDFRCCHRRLLADKLQVMGARVVHIVDSATAEEHALHSDLAVVSGQLIYARRQLSLL